LVCIQYLTIRHSMCIMVRFSGFYYRRGQSQANEERIQ
jgi:hypothetical protein